MSRRPLSIGLPLTALVAGCSGGTVAPPAAESTGLLVDVAPDCGIDFTITAGDSPPTEILEVKSGGVVLFDWQGDGDWDVFFPNGATLESPRKGPGARLFENLGNLRFDDATERAELGFDRWGMGAAAGDLDADGRVDLFVAAFGEDAVLMQGPDGALLEPVVGLVDDDRAWSSGVALGDLDLDGDLDAYVARYLRFDPQSPPAPTQFLGVEVFGGPMGLAAVPDHLWINDGDGEFVERSATAGTADVEAAHGLGAVILDLDDDGHLDLYVGNDSMADFVFMGRGGATFEERGADLGLATGGDGRGQATMGIAVADVNGDGSPDLFTTNFSHDTNTLRTSQPSGRWRDVTTTSGLGAASRPFCGWSATIADLDLDGDEELLAFNGHVYPDGPAELVGSNRLQPPLYYERDGDRFRRATGEPWLEAAHCDRGAAFGDLDRDGDLDAVVVDLEGPVRVLENRASANRSVTILIADTRDLGAKLELVDGDWKRTRWIASGLGYQSGSAPEAVFGVGARPGPFELVVTWPGGEVHSHTISGPGVRMSIGHGWPR